MVKVKKETLTSTTSIVKSVDQKHVFEFTNEYDFDGKKAVVITLSSESSNSLTCFDRTKYFTFNNLSKIGYSKITIFNLFTRVNEKLKPSNYSEEEIEDSLKYLDELLKSGYDNVVVAFGTTMSKNRRVKECKKQLLERLVPYYKEGKVVRIVDDLELYKRSESECLHPLYAGNYIGGRWKLIPYNVELVLNILRDDEKRLKEREEETNEVH